MNSVFYLGIEPASNQGECTTISVLEYTMDPGVLYKVRYLQRFPAGAPYSFCINTLNQIVKELRGGCAVMNTTFCGDPVVAAFKQGGVVPVCISIAQTEAAIVPHVENAVDPLRKYDHLSWKVPYRDIVGGLQVVFQQNQLQIAGDLDLAQNLIDEITHFKVEVSPSGVIEKLRVDANSDLLLSVAIAVYVAVRFGGPQIPIENMMREESHTPSILDEEAGKMPVIYDQQEINQLQGSRTSRLKYKWAQPDRIKQESNLPGLM